jgi:hypothetical protein
MYHKEEKQYWYIVGIGGAAWFLTMGWLIIGVMQ